MGGHDLAHMGEQRSKQCKGHRLFFKNEKHITTDEFVVFTCVGDALPCGIVRLKLWQIHTELLHAFLILKPFLFCLQ